LDKATGIVKPVDENTKCSQFHNQGYQISPCYSCVKLGKSVS
jgi:hypothetical protein